MELNVDEIYYEELTSISKSFKNLKFGIRIKTTPKTYEKDFASLVIEVKSRLHEIANQMGKKEEPKK